MWCTSCTHVQYGIAFIDSESQQTLYIYIQGMFQCFLIAYADYNTETSQKQQIHIVNRKHSLPTHTVKRNYQKKHLNPGKHMRIQERKYQYTFFFFFLFL